METSLVWMQGLYSDQDLLVSLAQEQTCLQGLSAQYIHPSISELFCMIILSGCLE